MILLGWAVVLGMGTPLALGYLSVLAPDAFAALVRGVPASVGSAGHPRPACAPSPCRLR